MNICYISSLRIPTERAYGQAVMRQCEAFADEGHEVRLLVPRKNLVVPQDPFEYHHIRKNFDIERAWATDFLQSPRGGKWRFWLDRVTFLLSVYNIYWRRLLDFDFVITREISFVPLALAGVKVILEIHALPSRRTFYLRLMALAHRVIVISNQLKSTLVALGVPAERILVLPSGVDLTTFEIDTPSDEARRELALPAGPLYLYTGNFTTMNEDKGIVDILKAIRELSHGTFVAVGAYQEDLDRYGMEAQKLGVQGRVIYRGRESQKRLALYQRAADILLMPFPDKPHYRNAMSPVKMFEYMCSGRPIIATDLPTIREVLDDGTAYIVPPGDPSALAAAMREAIVDVDGAKRRAITARGRIAQYSWRSRAKRITDSFKR